MRAKINHKPQLRLFARSYEAALQRHLRRTKPRFETARRLGKQAVTLGLETLDLAGVHKAALTEIIGPNRSSTARKRMVKQAEIFFIEAITPIEETHRAEVEWAARLGRKSKALARHTAQVASANHQLKQGINQRKTAEAALRKGEKNYAVLLEESGKLQKHLQSLTHRILSAHEDQRRKISHDLREEIAQTLLGINVRLLTLRKGTAARDQALANDIAKAQRLVKKSVKSINRFARGLRASHEE